MASRPILTPFPVITNGNMASSITSIITITQMLSMISYDISWTGTSPVGVISVQSSNTYATDASGKVINAGQWSTLPLSVTPTVSGNSGNGFIDIDASAGYAIRLVYTPTSGTGTLNVTVAGKVQ